LADTLIELDKVLSKKRKNKYFSNKDPSMKEDKIFSLLKELTKALEKKQTVKDAPIASKIKEAVKAKKEVGKPTEAERLKTLLKGISKPKTKYSLASLKTTIVNCSYKDAKSCVVNLLNIKPFEFSGYTKDDKGGFAFLVSREALKRARPLKFEGLEVQRWQETQLKHNMGLAWRVAVNATNNSENTRLQGVAKKLVESLEKENRISLNEIMDLEESEVSTPHIDL
jgi:hypothetical protein